MAWVSRAAMVLIVVGSWAALAQLATALMRPTYNAGLLTLRTATRHKRKARLSRVVATSWMYTIVFVALLTSFVGMGVLAKDPADVFGFQKYVLSWEYVLHPRFVALLCLSGLSASAAAVARFRRSNVMNAAAYDAASKLGFAVFSGVAAVGFAFLLALEATRSAAPGPAMPSGGGVAKAVAVLVASRASLAGFGGASRDGARELIDRQFDAAGVTGEDRAKLEIFAYSLPRRADVALESLQSRMRSKGFDAETATGAASELRAAMARS